MTAEVESMKTRRWLRSRRGSSDRSINILMTGLKSPIQHLLVFPFHYQTDGTHQFQISTETISTVEKTNQSYVEDSVATTEGNADGNVKNWPLLSPHTVTESEEKKKLMQISKVLHLDACAGMWHLLYQDGVSF